MRAIFVGLLFAPMALFAADFSSLYDVGTLENQRPRFRSDVDRIIAQEILPFLTIEQSHAFLNIQIDLPVIAVPEPNPFDFYSAKEGHITLPLLTVAFVEDLSEAYAWLWANHCSSLTVDEYLGMLRNHTPTDFAKGRYPDPLTALHIPKSALEDPAVANMTQRVRGTTLSFILLHQFGHSSYRTSAEEAATKRKNGENDEEIADSFALEVMKKNSEPPAGLLMLVHGMMYLPTVPPKLHPLANARLKKMADFLDTRVREFAEGRPNERLTIIAIHSLANHLRQSATFLSDTTGQELWAEEGRKTTVSDLAPRQLTGH